MDWWWDVAEITGRVIERAINGLIELRRIIVLQQGTLLRGTENKGVHLKPIHVSIFAMDTYSTARLHVFHSNPFVYVHT